MLVRWLRRPFDATYNALVDPLRCERAALAVIVMFAGVWTLYGVLSNAATNVHIDVGEAIAWSREPAWGYKHPPMTAWIAAIWFGVFPVTDWSAYLLAMCMSASALWISWRLFGEWLDAERRVLALAMLMLIPLYTFHALKFNVNVVMMPFWAATTLWFLRSVLRRGRGQAALAGVGGAGAMLSKYWSVNLVAGFGLAALFYRGRAMYFKSSAPWITVAIMVVLLLPHVVWVLTRGAVATDFVHSVLIDNASRSRSLSYLAGCAAYAIAPLLVFACLRPSRAALVETLRPAHDDRALLAMAFWFPLLLPVLLNLIVPSRLTAVWTIPNWTLLPVVLLGSRELGVARRVGMAAFSVALSIPLLAMVASPFIAMSAHHKTVHNAGPRLTQSHYRLLGEATEQRWRQYVPGPLKWIGGDAELSYGTAFYTADRPGVIRSFALDTSDVARIARDGIAIMCLSSDSTCATLMSAAESRWKTHRDAITLTRTYRGVTGMAQRYVILVVPPSR